jgi:hypothetical protein
LERVTEATPETDLLPRIASFGLPGHSKPIAASTLSDPEWSRLVGDVLHQRLAGFLQAAVEAGALAVTTEQRAEVADLHLQACGTALRLERRLLDVAGLLEQAGIDVVVLKGTAVAHLAYPTPAVRSFGDNDLLLRSEQFEAAVRLFQAAGYRRQVAPPRPVFDRRFSKGATLKGTEGDELDLHRNLVFGTFGFAIDLDELFASAVDFDLGGCCLRGLGPETRLLHACYHAGLGDPDPRYSSLRDVAQMVTFGEHDVRRVLELSRQWRSHAVLARAFRLCRDHLGVDLGGPLVDALASYEPTRREQRAIAAYVGDNRHYAAKVAASLPYLDGIGTKLAFLRSAGLPSEEFVESRGGQSRVAWVRRGLRSLLQGGVR